MKLKLSFQGTILVGCLTVVFTTLVFVSVIIGHFLREQKIDSLENELSHKLILTEQVVKDRRPKLDTVKSLDKLADQLGLILGLRVTLISENGKVLGDSKIPLHLIESTENHLSRPEVSKAVSGDIGINIRHSATLGVGLMYAAKSLVMPNRLKLIVRLALPLSEVNQILNRIWNLVLSALVLGIILSVGAAYLMAKSVSRPLKALTSTATAIASGDLFRRFRRYPPNEAGKLGRAFDRMADTIQDKIETITTTRDRLAGVLKGMSEGVLVTDREGRILLTNQALIDMLALKKDPVGKMPSEIFRSADMVEAMRQTRLSGEQKTIEIRTLDPDPNFLELTVVKLPDTETKAGCVAVLHDVTQHRKTEQIRRDFVANVSHELRTPLAAIKGSAETLLDSALESPKYAKHFVEIIHRQSLRLEGLTKDLLELAKLESDKPSQNDQIISFGELADSVLQTIDELAEKRGIEIELDIPNPETTLWANRSQLEESLINLLTNAIKYTAKGGKVTLIMRREEKKTLIRVKDTGVGIPPEHLPRIFERFYRVDKNRSRELGGTGLGLAIVKHFVQSQKGKVEVTSEVGKGSEFTLTFPA